MLLKYTSHKLVRYIFIYIFLIIMAILSLLLVNHNEGFYKQTIARVIQVQQDQSNTSSQNTAAQNDTAGQNSMEAVYDQKLTLKIINGEYKGKLLDLDNQYSESGAYDYRYRVGDRVFLSLENTSGNTFTGIITGIKRDQYLVIAGWIFLIFLIIVGKKKGFLSALSLTANAVIFYYALDIYRSGTNLLILCGIIAVAFTVSSMLIVSGNNRKTYSAILSTVTSTLAVLLISWAVILLTNGNGIRYEEMQFITRPIYPIFMSEILMGSLGAIMDIAITISSSIYELFNNNTGITRKALAASGMEIGRDIMGTMSNVLLFAYISGSVPLILIYMKNGMPVWNAFYSNLSLELVRALTGSIGIVLSIPISLYISIFLLRKRIKA